MVVIRKSRRYEQWERSLKDQTARAAIAARIFRLANGLAGDAKALGDGLSELRIHYGPGYRVYFSWSSGELILLLCGGTKSDQERDIRVARQMIRDGGMHD